MKHCALFVFLLTSVVCYGQFKDKTLDVIRMKEMQKYQNMIYSSYHIKDTLFLLTKTKTKRIPSLVYSPLKIKRTEKEQLKDKYYIHTLKGLQYLKNNDSIQSIPCFLSADSVILKHPEILENELEKKVHSYVLFQLGLAYLKTNTLEDHEKATDYFDRSESLGYKEAYIFSNISRSGTYMIQRIKNMNNSKPLQKDSVSSNSE